jgi:hypothetical protein
MLAPVTLALAFGTLALLGAGHASAPAGRPAAVPSGSHWKLVIRDAYDGRLDHHHSCAAVRAANARIPVDKTFCRICITLRAYEHRLC